MLFNSYDFLLKFFPAVFLIFFIVSHWSRVGAAYWLAMASLAFYGWWSMKALPLLLLSIIANFYFGKRIARFEGCDADCDRVKKRWLVFAVSSNILLLVFFKYADFLIENFNHVTSLVGGEQLALLNILLPIGISFYTFTQIAFLVDCWQGKVKEVNFSHYVLFVSYFPHLIAGPVLHHSEMMPQFQRKETYRINYDAVAVGMSIFIIGLAKKVLIADTLSGPADAFFNNVTEENATFWNAWLGVLAYTLQIYFDFSGYSDMAIGISLFFGIRLPINFSSPYKALSIIEFWRCWHMSLSRFLRDYLYIPLGGSEKGLVRRYINLFVTMLLGGLWHGANWTFVLWGVLHGVLLSLNHAWRYLMGEVKFPCAKQLFGAVTFLVICMTWVPFRADSIKAALTVYCGMIGLNGFGSFAHESRLLLAIVFGLAIVFLCKNTQEMYNYQPVSKDAVNTFNVKLWPAYSVIVVGTLLFVCLLRIGAPSPFLYFQF